MKGMRVLLRMDAFDSSVGSKASEGFPNAMFFLIAQVLCRIG